MLNDKAVIEYEKEISRNLRIRMDLTNPSIRIEVQRKKFNVTIEFDSPKALREQLADDAERGGDLGGDAATTPNLLEEDESCS